MKIRVNETVYEGFTAAAVSIQLDLLTRSFSFSATSSEGEPLPFKLGDKCEVLVDDVKVLTGHIELINVSGSATSHQIDIQGRGNTGDLLDSSIGSMDSLKTEGMTLKQACEKVIAHIGATITVKDELNPAPFNVAERLLVPETGQGAFDFLEQLARSKQALLTETALGELLITASSGEEIDAFLQHIDNGVQNNVLEYEAAFDSTGRYNLYQLQSQQGMMMAALAGLISNKDMTEQSGEETDSDIRRGRQMILVAEGMMANETDKERAQWEANIRQARGRTYSAIVHGFRNQTGDLWEVNRLIQVVDEFSGIDATMLINAVEFSMDNDAGRQTRVSMVERNAYTLTLEEPQEDKIGIGLVFAE